MPRPNTTGVKWRRGGEDEKAKMREYQKVYKSKKPEFYKKAQRASALRRQYGITYEQYEDMVEEQKGKCLICKEIKALHVDHCHKTGKVRGLLCISCNGGLGMFKDNTKSLQSAIEYLQCS